MATRLNNRDDKFLGGESFRYSSLRDPLFLLAIIVTQRGCQTQSLQTIRKAMLFRKLLVKRIDSLVIHLNLSGRSIPANSFIIDPSVFCSVFYPLQRLAAIGRLCEKCKCQSGVLPSCDVSFTGAPNVR